MRFRSKVDWWIALLVIGVPVLATAVAAVAAFEEGQWWILPLMLGIYAVVGLICWPCEYVLMEDGLLVRSGVIRWRVPYAEIKRVYPTRNPLSSPAWSLDRLAIVYGKKWVMVSPADQVDFLTMLMNRANLRQQGEELVRQTQ